MAGEASHPLYKLTKFLVSNTPHKKHRKVEQTGDALTQSNRVGHYVESTLFP